MRPALSLVLILGGVGIYIVSVVTLADRLPGMPGLVQAGFWCVAGLAWVVPVRWLMFWGAGKR